jgi:hypothetical protein
MRPVTRRVVTLRGPGSEGTATVVVPQNQHGQLPSVLIDPVDSGGRVVPGVWLGDSKDRASDGTVYEWLKESG